MVIMGDSWGMSRTTIHAMKLMAADKDKSTALVQDDTCLGGLVMVLSNSDSSIVQIALETLHKLAEWPQHRVHMKNFIGMTDQLQTLISEPCPSVKELAQKVFDLLNSSYHSTLSNNTHHLQQHSFHAPLRDTRNQHKDSNSSTCAQKPKRRNSFFVGGGIGKNKMITLQVRGMHDREDIDVCRNRLLTVRGVISITFDFKSKRVYLRTKPDLKPELLAQAIARTMTMSAEQVVKDDTGKEMLLSFGSNATNLDKENEEMPDYPTDDSPIKGDNHLAKIGEGQDEGKKWGLIKTVGDFLSNTLYW